VAAVLGIDPQGVMVGIGRLAASSWKVRPPSLGGAGDAENVDELVVARIGRGFWLKYMAAD